MNIPLPFSGKTNSFGGTMTAAFPSLLPPHFVLLFKDSDCNSDDNVVSYIYEIMRRSEMLIIGICGASGSGKSTLAEELQARLNQKCLYIKQDSYYRDHPDLTYEQRTQINYDMPEAFEHDALCADLCALAEGKPITAKNYDYTQHRRADTAEMIEPADVILIEGIHTFYDPAVRNMMDFKIYIQVDPDICLLRRVERDLRERGRSIESISEQYRQTVKPMYELYIRNYAKYADLIVANGGRNARIVDLLALYINSGMIAEKKTKG